MDKAISDSIDTIWDQRLVWNCLYIFKRNIYINCEFLQNHLLLLLQNLPTELPHTL